MEPIDIDLKKLWEAGKTSSQIAKALGISRSAVMGRVFRLRAKGVVLAARPAIRGPSKPKQEKPSPPQKKVEAMPFVMPKFKPAPAPKPEPVQPVPEPVKDKAKPLTIMELTYDHCRYIVRVSKARGPLYCGETKAVRSYCAEHAKLCYQPLIKKEQPKQPLNPSHFRLDPLNGTRL